jgi:hypothetical protein
MINRIDIFKPIQMELYMNKKLIFTLNLLMLAASSQLVAMVKEESKPEITQPEIEIIEATHFKKEMLNLKESAAQALINAFKPSSKYSSQALKKLIAQTKQTYPEIQELILQTMFKNPELLEEVNAAKPTTMISSGFGNHFDDIHLLGNNQLAILFDFRSLRGNQEKYLSIVNTATGIIKNNCIKVPLTTCKILPLPSNRYIGLQEILPGNYSLSILDLETLAIIPCGQNIAFFDFIICNNDGTLNLMAFPNKLVKTVALPKEINLTLDKTNQNYVAGPRFPLMDNNQTIETKDEKTFWISNNNSKITKIELPIIKPATYYASSYISPDVVNFPIRADISDPQSMDTNIKYTLLNTKTNTYINIIASRFINPIISSDLSCRFIIRDKKLYSIALDHDHISVKNYDYIYHYHLSNNDTELYIVKGRSLLKYSTHRALFKNNTQPADILALMLARKQKSEKGAVDVDILAQLKASTNDRIKEIGKELSQKMKMVIIGKVPMMVPEEIQEDTTTNGKQNSDTQSCIIS